MNPRYARRAAVWLIVAAMVTPAAAQRQMEFLERGLVAVRCDEHRVFLSWRLLGTDPAGISFNVYRSSDNGPPLRLNGEPLGQATCLLDEEASAERTHSYFVRALVEGEEQPPSPAASLPVGEARPYHAIPLRTPAGYMPGDSSVGDLDGDGTYEIVVHQTGRGRDNSQSGFTRQPLLEAYKLDGTFLWRIDLGRNIREGAHYVPFLVYDFDGDGKAEVACKTADGTIDGSGEVIGDGEADFRSQEQRTQGKILAGPEYLTIFEGLTGKALVTADYLPPRGDIRDWGDDYGNRVDRFLACVAYLDGQRPSLVMCRGYYERTVLAAWDWREGHLTQRWIFDSDDGTPGNRDYRGQGNHNLSVGDVDGDQRDEIIYGSCVIDDDGRGLYSTGLGHGDAMHFTDIDPLREGLEVFKANGDGPSRAGLELRPAGGGEPLFMLRSSGRGGVARACALDIDPRHAGLELWGKGSGVDGLYNARGELLTRRAPRTCNMGIWWDGDLLRELLDGVRIAKWDFENDRESVLLDGREFGVAANNGSKSNPCLCADLLGDWREELITRSDDGRELRIFISTSVTEHRLPTLMHDPVYRLGIAWQNVGYNQPAHPGYYLGHGMLPPPRPPIHTAPIQTAPTR